MKNMYISIEKNTEVFELYKSLWKVYNIYGIMADTMTNGIQKALAVEKSQTDKLFFIDIVADDINFMPQLKILSEETNAPILIATNKYSVEEHHEALYNGADFYAEYCETTEKNINGVLSVVNSIQRRTKKLTEPNEIVSHGDILIVANNQKAFVKDHELILTKSEMKVFYYLMANRGNILTHGKIQDYICYDDDKITTDNLYNIVKRLRKKIRDISGQTEYIETVKDIGYRISDGYGKKI